jgi:hypothetical protein
MKFIYNIKDEQGNKETLQAMSYKKLIKQLNNKYKVGEVIQVKYNVSNLTTSLAFSRNMSNGHN